MTVRYNPILEPHLGKVGPAHAPGGDAGGVVLATGSAPNHRARMLERLLARHTKLVLQLREDVPEAVRSQIYRVGCGAFHCRSTNRTKYAREYAFAAGSPVEVTFADAIELLTNRVSAAHLEELPPLKAPPKPAKAKPRAKPKTKGRSTRTRSKQKE